MRLHIVGLDSLPEIAPGDDLAALIREAAGREAESIGPATLVAVAQKVVSKAEGAVVDLSSVVPSDFAARWAARWHKDARLIELVLRESRRVVRMDGGVLIAETHHGMVAANAGVDQSNVGDGFATVLPRDPDASARRLREALGAGAVILIDSFGRPWREGLVDTAIGVAGLEAVEDWRGRVDRNGRSLSATIMATADQLAAAAGLVMRKDAGTPVALITGYRWQPAAGTASALVRPPERDLFR